jgi:hypothetical protein
MESGNRAGAQSRPVDWSEWRHAPEVKVWEAVALSLGVEPSKVRFHRDAWMAGPESVIADEGPEFATRSRMTIRAMGHELVPASMGGRVKARWGVYLPEFAAWVRDVVEWSAPPELIALAAPPPAVESIQSASTAPLGALRWTDERKTEARSMRDKLKADGVRDYAAQTAAHFGVSAKRLREILSDGEPPAKAASPFPVSAFKGKGR